MKNGKTAFTNVHDDVEVGDVMVLVEVQQTSHPFFHACQHHSYNRFPFPYFPTNGLLNHKIPLEVVRKLDALIIA